MTPAGLERRWADYLASLTPESLEELVYKRSTSSGLGKRFGTRRGDVLLHVCTHAHYTAAQVVNMLRHAGAVKLPATRLISLARQEMLLRARSMKQPSSVMPLPGSTVE